jgi:RNA polymerase sigma factor (sigma-70 family)
VHPHVESHEDGADGLVKLFRAGDERALRRLFDQFGPAVFHLATLCLANVAAAEDVTRSTFVAAWLAREHFDPAHGSLLAWLLGIARSKIAEQPKRAPRHPGNQASNQAGNQAANVVESGGEPPPERVVDQLVLADELAKLRGEQRRVLELAFYDGLTHTQIAAVTGLPLDTVKTHLSSGMVALRRRWEVDGVASGTRSAGAPGPR